MSDLGRNDVLAMVAHELRAPLGSVLNTVELLRHVQQGDRERMAEWIERISRQTEYMSRLIEDLVEVSRTGRYGLRLRMEKVDLRNPVGAAIEACLPLIHARRHKLEVALAEHPIWVEADPTRLQQVVANLLTNGAQYTEPGGVIEVMLHQCGQFAILRVKDSGIGILPEALERIFEPFTQGGTEVRRSREGLGIGLAVVRSVVEQHRGAVQARSAGPLQGSEFIVRLPALPA